MITTHDYDTHNQHNCHNPTTQNAIFFFFNIFVEKWTLTNVPCMFSESNFIGLSSGRFASWRKVSWSHADTSYSHWL